MTWKRTRRSGTLLASALVLGLASLSACTTASLPASGVNGSAQTGPRQAATPSASSAPVPRARPKVAVLQLVDGGPDYYARFSPSLPVSPSFFPIGVWFDSVTQESDTRTDKGAGINVYVQMTDNSNMALVRQADMYAIDSNYTKSYGRETVGWEVPDETDMWGGPGRAKWSGNYAGQGPVCTPSAASCGYSILSTMLARLPKDHRLRYANFGKGVTFWDSYADAAEFVNDFVDVASDDNYWLTDDDICDLSQGGQYFPKKDLVPATATTPAHLPPQLCHLPSNYYITVHAVRSLESPEDSRPIWGFVELAHPSNNNGWPTATPSKIVAAVWASLIGGARGIIYFNHSFGGSCITDSALRDPCYAKVYTAVGHVDSEIRSLAPVLNAPFADHVVAASSGVIFTVKWYKGHFYLIAGSRQPGPQVARFSMPCVGSAKVAVLFENRTLNLKDGLFADRFANGDTDHIYRIDGGWNCGA
jgi:hypothetical protein